MAAAEAEIRVESVQLDDRVPVVFRDYGQYIRVAYDPAQITRAKALKILRAHLHVSATEVHRRADV